jgi:glycosyltransferase involved in cell wall biosynthesis
MGPLFSIVIPTIDRPAFLERAVDSVLAQSISDFEILVVNDGGATPLLPADDRIRLLERDRPGGPAVARNLGIEHATGRFVAFLDDDDRYLANRLELALEGLAHAEIAVCESVGHPLSRRLRAPSGVRMARASFADTIFDGQMVVDLASVAVDRELAPRFRDDYLACEDWEWWLRLAQRGPVVVVFEAGWERTLHAGARVLHGFDARAEFSQRLLEDHYAFFMTHRRARAYRQMRLGLLERRIGNRKAAARALGASFLSRPALRTAYHYSRTRLGG